MPSARHRAGRTGLLLLAAVVLQAPVNAQDTITGTWTYVVPRATAGSFPLARAGSPAPILISSSDWPGVRRAAASLQADLERVTGKLPQLALDSVQGATSAVIIGTVGKSPLIERLVSEKRIDVSRLAGRWETFQLQNIEKPFPGIERALVIAGSDKRGTIYGIYDLSAQIGVSPWYWWADVPVRRQRELHVLPGVHTQGEPAVKYRGFFINDEAPALSGWSRDTFGGFNSKFYEKVFELLLRMKGNYLWPAMWGNAFNDDDKLNPQLADEYGVVMGTSHHEPMLRAQQEWRRYGKGPWSYVANQDTLQQFWRDGIRNMGPHESIVTLGMRGDGDMPMGEHGNIELLERIVGDQRKIIAEVTGKDASATPQLWALYKEVQEYYDRGMRVPDDVTLLFADDNWGNIRRLPKVGAAPRAGGYGVYYHLDYVGGPRNYKWLNTNQIERVWEQMQRAYDLHARTIWIVNVGDIKPMEFPLQFFLDHAWNPEQWPVSRVTGYARSWAAQQFGSQHASEIGRLLDTYTRFNARRKPELLSPLTYSLDNYGEGEHVVREYRELEQAAERINRALPQEYRSAFYQLVLHPIQASANLNDLYFAAAQNRRFAAQGRASANELAARVEALFARDAQISAFYNDTLAGGKWRHMMDQTHIGYTGWQQPPSNTMPAVTRLELPDTAALGVAVEGSQSWWPNETRAAQLLPLHRAGARGTYIDLFNRGRRPFAYNVRASAPWLRVSPARGTISTEQRLTVSIDWQRVPAGAQSAPITITGAGSTITVQASIAAAPPEAAAGFTEAGGYVSMEAQNYTRAVNTNGVRWLTIPNLGRTLSAVTATRANGSGAPREPDAVSTPGGNSPRLEYQVHLTSADSVTVLAYFSPTLDYNDRKGLRYGISFDDEPPRIVNMLADTTQRGWERSVADNIRILASRYKPEPGAHVLKFWLVDPGVVLQKIVIDAGGVRPSYLGPPESVRLPARKAVR